MSEMFYVVLCALQIALPLLLQGHVDLLEEYLSRSREHQVTFVQLIDQLIDSDTSIDAFVRSTTQSIF